MCPTWASRDGKARQIGTVSTSSMRTNYRLEVDIASIMEDSGALEIAIDTPEGTPNVAAREDIKITNVAPIVASVEGACSGGALLNRRWSWPDRRESPFTIINAIRT